MKAAYLAYDRNSLVGLSVLSNYFEQVDFYLVDSNRQPEATEFSEVSIMTDHLMVPSEEGLRTPAHVKILKSVHGEFNFYKKQLEVEVKKNPVTYTEVQKNCRTEMNSLTLIKDIAFNPKTNEVYVEKEKMGITPYQYLFIEEHHILAESFAGYSKNIFKTQPENSHIWFATEFDYEMKKPRTGDLGRREFFLIKDHQNKTILDNWYFVRTLGSKITIHQWVPFNQFKNSDFQKFIIERVEKLIKERLELVQLTRFSQFYVNSTAGFATQEASLKHAKISTCLPAFHFWSRDMINRYLYTKLDSKMKELNKLQLAMQNQNLGS